MSNILNISDMQPHINLVNFFQVIPNTIWERKIYDFEFVLVLEGELSYTCNDDKIYLYEGDVLCIYPGVSHILKHEKTDLKTSISCIHFEMLKNNSWLDGDYKLNDLPAIKTNMLHDYEVRHLFRKSCDIFNGFNIYREDLLQLILKEIYLRIISVNKKVNPDKLSFRIQKMVHYIQINYDKVLTRQVLASEFCLSPEYLNTIFKNETGLTPTEFIHRTKIHKAYNMLNEEDLSVKEVADRICFYDQCYFSKIFKRIMGFSPSRVTKF